MTHKEAFAKQIKEG